jgi:hypothetical protein
MTITSTQTKRTREQGLALVEAQAKSTLKIREFCKQENIAYHIFKYWLGVYKKNLPQNKKNTFIPMKVFSSDSVVKESVQVLKVIPRSGIILEVPAGFDKNTFQYVFEVCKTCG